MMKKEQEVIKIINNNKPSTLLKVLYGITGVGNKPQRTLYIIIMICMYITAIVFDNTGNTDMMITFSVMPTIILFTLMILQLTLTLLNNKRILKIAKLLDVDVESVGELIERYEITDE
jgi:hypothetical protein